MFRHISADPKSREDMIPVEPFWRYIDVLLGARYVLRRRNGEEVNERAAIIQQKLMEFVDDIVETAEKTGVSMDPYVDEVSMLDGLIMPDRYFPNIATKVKGTTLAHLEPITGWSGAEDFAVLALLKIDESIDAINDETPQDLIVCAGLLLEAYRCLLFAERARGRDVVTVEEFEEYEKNYLEAVDARISKQNSKATQNRKTEAFKVYVFGRYVQIKQEWPSKGMYEIADEISAEHVERLSVLTDNDCKLSRTNAKRTIREWIKEEFEPATAKTKLRKSPQQIKKELRKKNKF